MKIERLELLERITLNSWFVINISGWSLGRIPCRALENVTKSQSSLVSQSVRHWRVVLTMMDFLELQKYVIYLVCIYITMSIEYSDNSTNCRFLLSYVLLLLLLLWVVVVVVIVVGGGAIVVAIYFAISNAIAGDYVHILTWHLHRQSSKFAENILCS
jgi:hypothetical protein